MCFCLPSPVLSTLKLLNDAGYEAYVVGGCVRDLLMGTTPHDWDITTSALPEQTLELFAGHRTINTGLKHGTVTVMMDGMPLEVTTYRVDGTYTDGRHPDSVTFSRSLTEDLKRRDFTINAMAYHPTVGLVDLFDGQHDLREGIIRCVGDPHRRFCEDSLRIMRALRFAATLSFVIESQTEQAIHDFYPSLEQVSAERISAELIKLLCGRNATAILSGFSDVLASILSPIQISTVNLPLLKMMDLSPLSRLTLLLYETNEDTAREILQHKLRLSNQLTDDVCAILRHSKAAVPGSDAEILRLLGQLGAVRARTLLAIRSAVDNTDYSSQQRRIDQLMQGGACYTISQLALNGDDLMAAGIAPGPAIRTTLNELLEAVITGCCDNNKVALTEYVKRKPVR